MGLFLDMSDVQYVQYWTKYVQYWTNTGISQQSDYVQGWFWCQNYCLITDINLYINFNQMNSSPIHPIFDNVQYWINKAISLYLCKQTTNMAGFGVKMTV